MRKVFFRYLAYLIGTSVLILGLTAIAGQFPGTLQFDRIVAGAEKPTSEFTSVEILQVVGLIFCASVFAWVASRDRLRRPMTISIATMFIVFMLRELDFFMDTYLVNNLWEVLLAVVLAVSIVYCVRNRQRFVQGWRRSWPSAGIALIVGGIILLIPVAQSVGDQRLWMTIMGDDYQRVIRVTAEEFVEFSAYIMMTIGSIEFLYTWSRLPRTRTIAAPPTKRR